MTATAASEAFEQGDIATAVAAATAAVKAKPTDRAARGLLAELLCFEGHFERVDKHLDLLVDQASELAPQLAAFRQVLRGAVARREVFEKGRAPDFIDEPPNHLALSLRALATLRAGDAAGAAALAAEAEETRPPTGGTADGVRFADWRDLDDLMPGVLEVVTAKGGYYWVPMERVVRLAFHTPRRPRDLIWREAELEVRDGPEALVYVPALYPGSEASADDALRLGRATDWQGGDGAGPVRGVGQRTWLFDENDRPLMEVGEIATGAPA